MRIFSPIVLPSPAIMQAFEAASAGRCAERSQVVRDQPLGDEGILLQKLAHQFQSGVSGCLEST
jgi:hypothetical protein